MCYSHPSCNILSIPICFSPFLFQLKIGGGKVDFLAKFFLTLAAIFKEYSVVYLCWSLNINILAEVVEKKGSKGEGWEESEKWEPGSR